MKALIVGLGRPGRSMGWYHCQNLLRGQIAGVASSPVFAVVDPFYGCTGRPESTTNNTTVSWDILGFFRFFRFLGVNCRHEIGGVFSDYVSRKVRYINSKGVWQPGGDHFFGFCWRLLGCVFQVLGRPRRRVLGETAAF